MCTENNKVLKVLPSRCVVSMRFVKWSQPPSFTALLNQLFLLIDLLTKSGNILSQSIFLTARSMVLVLLAEIKTNERGKRSERKLYDTYFVVYSIAPASLIEIICFVVNRV